MKQPAASTPAQYLAQQPADRRASLERVRDVILTHLPPGYEEAMALGLIVYQIPLSRYPKTYNGQPLWLAALGAQKNYLVLYLMAAYGDGGKEGRLRKAFAAAGKKLDMGKSCIRFQTADDLVLEPIGQIIAETTVERYLANYESVKRAPAKGKRAAQKKKAAR